MKIFLAGATGATGSLLARFLLQRGYHLTAVVRSPDRLPPDIRSHQNIEIVRASLLDLPDSELQRLVAGCSAIASCLGHNISFKGIYSHPRLLVTDAARRLCQVVIANREPQPVRYILMNTVGNRNRDLDEKIALSEQLAIALMRLLLPPQRDNERAAEYLRVEIGQDLPAIEWVAVRPDGLIDQDQVSEYTLHPSPTRSALFASGVTSRINVAHFMANLITDDTLWQQWKGRMPVIYNKDQSKYNQE